jgi:hypothetical protein
MQLQANKALKTGIPIQGKWKRWTVSIRIFTTWSYFDWSQCAHLRCIFWWMHLFSQWKSQQTKLSYLGYGKSQHHREHFRDSPKVIVWCCFLYDRIIGPFFFSWANCQRNLLSQYVENFALPQLQEAEAQSQHEIRFQQDGAPPHWSLHVRALPNQLYPSRWLGRDGPIAWPPRSPDLTPPDFFYGAMSRTRCTRPPFQTSTSCGGVSLMVWLVVTAIPQATLYAVWREMQDRLDICWATNGAHVEGGTLR